MGQRVTICTTRLELDRFLNVPKEILEGYETGITLGGETVWGSLTGDLMNANGIESTPRHRSETLYLAFDNSGHSEEIKTHWSNS